MYISEVNTLTETSVLGKRCLKHPSKVFEMKRKGIFVPSKQLEPSLPTARSTAVRHTLGILMPSHNQIQADPAAGHTHVCLSHSAEGYGNSDSVFSKDAIANQTTAAASKQRTPAKPPAVPGLPRGRTDMLARTMGITRVEDLPDRDHTVW